MSVTRSKRVQRKAAEPESANGNGATPEIVWVDELPPNTRQNKWMTLMEPFTQNPGKWGRLPHEFPTQGGASALAHRLTYQKGNIKLPDGEWEFTHRQVGDKFYVFARYSPSEQ